MKIEYWIIAGSVVLVSAFGYHRLTSKSRRSRVAVVAPHLQEPAQVEVAVAPLPITKSIEPARLNKFGSDEFRAIASAEPAKLSASDQAVLNRANFEFESQKRNAERGGKIDFEPGTAEDAHYKSILGQFGNDRPAEVSAALLVAFTSDAPSDDIISLGQEFSKISREQPERARQLIEKLKAVNSPDFSKEKITELISKIKGTP